MSHTAGLSGLAGRRSRSRTSTTGRRSTSLLAAQEPWWEPGTASGYHAVTQGYLEGEIVRRVTGQTIGEFVAKEVTGPLGADFHIGTARRARRPGRPRHPADARRCPIDGVDQSSVAYRTLTNPPLAAEVSATIPWRRAEIPAAGGHGNARSVALIHTPMACGGEANGVRLLSPKGIDVGLRRAEQRRRPRARRRRCATASASACRRRTCRSAPTSGRASGAAGAARWRSSTSMPGWLSYVMNQMGEGTVGDIRGAGLLLAAYTALGQL